MDCDVTGLWQICHVEALVTSSISHIRMSEPLRHGLVEQVALPSHVKLTAVRYPGEFHGSLPARPECPPTPHIPYMYEVHMDITRRREPICTQRNRRDVTAEGTKLALPAPSMAEHR